MHLSTLLLANFRNYNSLKLECDEHANLFLGSNGQGKTNLLEAIYYLCVARSCREALDRDLVIIDGDAFLIRGSGISSTGHDVDLEIRYARRTGKKVLINGQPQRNLSDLFGSMTAVVMSPDDRQIVQGGPGCRRRFLDIAIAQSSPAYLNALQDYKRVVKQRNETLRAHQMRSESPADLELWDMQLVELGSRIVQKRQSVVLELEREAQSLHGAISDDKEELCVTYKSSFEFGKVDDVKAAFIEALARSEREERSRGLTVVGPHRDDLILTMNGVNLSAYGSQGQHKTAATAIKLSEALFLLHKTHSPPLLLLDDIFAELDALRTTRLIELLPVFGQVFITAAKESDIGAHGDRFRRFNVHAGQVTRM
ncbi:MAG: DNA replication/repair protein RecF [Candidatus Latescibacteria bacterium]|nr:DNA replication/repair protein RecF [Candidatus Latescibacterota bacterium]